MNEINLMKMSQIRYSINRKEMIKYAIEII